MHIPSAVKVGAYLHVSCYDNQVFVQTHRLARAFHTEADSVPPQKKQQAIYRFLFEIKKYNNLALKIIFFTRRYTFLQTTINFFTNK